MIAFKLREVKDENQERKWKEWKKKKSIDAQSKRSMLYALPMEVGPTMMI